MILQGHQEKSAILQQYEQLESQKEEILNEFKEKNNDIVVQIENCIDVKQEMDFEIIMLNKQQDRAKQRGEAQLQDQRHKIDIIRLNHDKIRKESKSLNKLQ